MEAWAGELFENVSSHDGNEWNLVHSEACSRLGMADIILQFKKQTTFGSVVTANVDSKATAEDLEKSGKSPNITSFARIRFAYVEDADFIFVILSLKHKVFCQKNLNTGLMDGVMEVVNYKAYDLKYISEADLSYNPALGTGQLQIRDIHYVNIQTRTTWEFCQMLDAKFLSSSKSPRHDDILMFSKTDKYKFNLDAIRVPQKYYRKVNNMRGANPGDVWEVSHIHYCQKGRQPHPTQKPEALIERMVLASSNEGDLVVDPFSGSGTTMRVCQQLERNGLGIELNEEYIEQTKERLNSKFEGFDSIDERMLRVPNDLNDPAVRKEYINNHIKWFLKNHPDRIDKFMDEVKAKYSKKLSLQTELCFDFG